MADRLQQIDINNVIIVQNIFYKGAAKSLVYISASELYPRTSPLLNKLPDEKW